MKLTDDQLQRYIDSREAVPLDEEIRKTFRIPKNRYYSVSMNPYNLGEVKIDLTRNRVLESVKISKSDQA